MLQAEDILRNNTLRGSEELAGRLAAAPDKYILWSCGEMANEARDIAGREHDLEALMKKAEVDAGGRFASAIA